jgi:hypothetical protein
MSLDPRETADRGLPPTGAAYREAPPRSGREDFATSLFTGLNIAVFLILAASIAAAGALYGQGA